MLMFRKAMVLRAIMKIKWRKIKAKKSGFTLVEIVAVLFVVAIGLVGVLSLIVQNIQSQNISKNTITAYQLAQEGVELVRKVRDTNWLATRSWNAGMLPGVYYMDYQDALPNILSAGDEALYKDASGFYVHGGGVATPFSRVIEIEEINPSAYRIYSRVTWSDRNNSFNYDVEALLYDWY